jgi:integration host factor subunit alpha
MTLTKARIIDSICNSMDLNKKQATKTVDDLLETVKKALESGEDVLISGFGKLCVREKKERKGRNPQTGENLILKQRRVVTFKCSKVLQDKLDGKR